ncbi:hypothetical protein INT45_007403 [Circinella minor]|uniref:Uncharacterized protein n=1 Tax=Circinella minor TaxID=1195481 RepID=A0A8H7VHS9_9FUNG|nr:hypothetical protein INT45_007403 [Circinella minor]
MNRLPKTMQVSVHITREEIKLEEDTNNQSQDILLDLELTIVEKSFSDNISILIKQDYSIRSNHLSGGHSARWGCRSASGSCSHIATKSNMVHSSHVGSIACSCGRHNATHGSS